MGVAVAVAVCVCVCVYVPQRNCRELIVVVVVVVKCIRLFDHHDLKEFSIVFSI